jgi:beta-lactamase superfamily II metal-dependent hydrolase
MPDEHAYISFPHAAIYEKPGSTKPERGKAVDHLIWGEWVRIIGTKGKWRKVRRRGKTGWLHEDCLQGHRVLEIYFVDIGQGDGGLVVTPDDRHLIIDAGAGDNMFRLLNWKYGRFRKEFTFDAAVMTHPDLDHYYGFRDLFALPKVKFKAIYHNGIVDRGKKQGANQLGRRVTIEGKSHITGLVSDEAALKRLFKEFPQASKTRYGEVLKSALAAQESGRVGAISMLDAGIGHLPGFASATATSPEIQVLGPVVRNGVGEASLPWFGNVGKTKNGHSVVLRLKYGSISVLLGGDLNIEAEQYLLQHYTKTSFPRAGSDGIDAFVAKARATFESDFAKACHHGSADFTDVFLRAVNARATIISSGDAEAYMHPRPDALGAFGRHGRGNRPLIFSTELSRSTEERVKSPKGLHNRLIKLQETIVLAKDQAAREKAKLAFYKEVSKLGRSVDVYGMINLRTDGKKVLFAHMIEKPRAMDSRWDIHVFEPDGQDLKYESKYSTFQRFGD